MSRVRIGNQAIENGFTEYVCQDCCEKELEEYESLEAAKEDHYEAKRRGEL